VVPNFALHKAVCTTMDLNKAVVPWRRKSWRERYSKTMSMQNQAKLAAGGHRGHMAKVKHFSKAYEQVPALICDSYVHRSLRTATLWGGGFAIVTKIPPPT